MALGKTSTKPTPILVGPNQRANNQEYEPPVGHNLRARASALLAQGFKLKSVTLPPRKKKLAFQVDSEAPPVKGQPAPPSTP